MSDNLKDNTQLKLVIKENIEELLKASPSIEFVMVSTVDGYKLALAGQPALERKVSAMTSTMLALSGSVMKEMRLGTLEEVILNGSHGVALFMNVTNEIIWLGVCKNKSSLGILLSNSKRCSSKLKKFL